MSEFKILPAKNISISSINSGNIEKDETGLCLMIGNEKIEKVCVYGVVVSVEKDDVTKKINITLDDGSSLVSVVVFDSERMDARVVPGCFAKAIGKIRFFDESLYIACDIIKKVTKPWAEFGKKIAEKSNYPKTQEKKQESKNYQKGKSDSESGKDEKPEKPSEKYENKNESPFDSGSLDIEEDDVVFESSDKKLLDFIKSKDKGEGVAASEIIESGIQDSESVLKKLLREGEIYEVRPGIYRVV